MGVPSGGGTNLGAAQGRITLDISQLQAAQVAVQAAARQINAALNEISPGAKKAQSSINQLAQTLQQFGSAFGIAFGAASIAQLARFAVGTDEIATSYRRQSVAAENLAGSQARLNELLQIYDRATGGVIGKAQALSDVTRLLAVGFADSAEELDTFVRAVRGISIATGRPQEFVVTQLQLELLNQTGFRLDQIGLGMEEVRKKADELQAANSNLTQEQAYQIAVLETANTKFGALTRSAAAQITAVEGLRKAWTDFQLEIGTTGSPAINAFAQGATKELKGLSDTINDLIADITNLRKAMDELSKRGRKGAPKDPITDFFTEAVNNFLFEDPFGDFIDYVDQSLSDWITHTAGQMTELEQLFAKSAAEMTASRQRPAGSLGPITTGFTTEQTAAIVEWSRDVAEIERNAARDRLEATRQYESQRTSIIRDYEQTIASEAQDFALQRQRAEEDYAISLQRIHRDIGRREVQQAEELERTLADARADAQERTADRLNDLEERIADARATSRERIAELEEDFNRRRERAQRDHHERLRDAAANLDAVRVRELQRDFRNSRRDAKEDLDDRLGDERKNEAKRLADLKKAHDKQTADEKENLEERIQQAQDAHQRQLDAAREADSLRLEDMAADMLLRRTREDEDRAIRLERMREDFEAQLAELASNHLDRIVQINEQEAEELAARNTAFDEQMAELGIYHDGVKEAEAAHRARSLVLYQQYLDRLEAELAGRMTMQGPQPQNPFITPGQFPSMNPSGVAPSNVSNSTRSNVVNIHAGAVTLLAPANFAADESSRQWLHGELAQFFEDYLN